MHYSIINDKKESTVKEHEPLEVMEYVLFQDSSVWIPV